MDMFLSAKSPSKSDEDHEPVPDDNESSKDSDEDEGKVCVKKRPMFKNRSFVKKISFSIKSS